MEVQEIPIESLELSGEDIPAPPGLVNSMAALGQLVPILAMPLASGHYEVVDGRRRVAAIRSLKWSVVRALVCRDAADLNRALVALAANVHSPNPLNEARAIAAVDDPDAVRQVSGLSTSEQEARTMLLKLAPEYQRALAEGRLRMRAARKLARLPLDFQRQAMQMAATRAKDPHRPTVAVVLAAIREVRGDLQPQLAVPFPSVASDTLLPDPVTLAAQLQRVAAVSTDPLALRRAALVLEQGYQVEPETEDDDAEPRP